MRVGGGLPLAMHLRDIEGPGWRVCSVNLNRKKGIASVRKRKQRIYKVVFKKRNCKTSKSDECATWLSGIERSSVLNTSCTKAIIADL